MNKIKRARLCEQKRGSGYGKLRERASFLEQKREDQILGKRENGPGSVNKRERARFCEHKRDGQAA